MSMPSNTFCWCEMADLKAFVSRMRPLRRSSSNMPRLCSQLVTLKRRALYVSLVDSESRYSFMPPTARSMDMLLSLRMMRMSLSVVDTLFRPSKASPPDMAPSPMTATTLRSVPLAATAIPRAAEMLFEACPHIKVSYSLSSGVGKGRMPPNLRLVLNCSRRPVSILCP